MRPVFCYDNSWKIGENRFSFVSWIFLLQKIGVWKWLQYGIGLVTITELFLCIVKFVTKKFTTFMIVKYWFVVWSLTIILKILWTKIGKAILPRISNIIKQLIRTGFGRKELLRKLWFQCLKYGAVPKTFSSGTFYLMFNVWKIHYTQRRKKIFSLNKHVQKQWSEWTIEFESFAPNLLVRKLTVLLTQTKKRTKWTASLYPRVFDNKNSINSIH